MKIQASAENYLETILVLSETLPEVRSVDVAAELGFSKPSVSVAMRNLRESGHIRADASGAIVLTELGLGVAEKIYERHVVVSKLLEFLGVDEKTALEDACRIEHALSETSFLALKRHAEAVMGKGAQGR